MAFRLSIAHLVCVSYEQVWKTRFAPANTRKTTKNRICTVSRAPKNMIKVADEKKKRVTHAMLKFRKVPVYALTCS